MFIYSLFSSHFTYHDCTVYSPFADVSKDAVEEMLTADDETDALAEFDFVMGEDSGSETDVTVIEMEGNGDGLEDMDIHLPEEPTTQGRFCCLQNTTWICWTLVK